MPAPMRTKTVRAAGELYPTGIFIGDHLEHTAAVTVALSGLTTAEVDADGYLKVGVPFTNAGALVGIAPAFVYGLNAETIKVADGNLAGDLTGNVEVVVSVQCVVNRAALEDVLGRALTADEVAGFDRAGSKCTLVE